MIAPSSFRWPHIVAEALDRVENAVATIGLQPELSSEAAVLARFTHATAPMRSAATPPTFLLPHQVEPWRRVDAALVSFGGAILAEPTGSGKSWVAAGIASKASTRPLLIAPAVLLSQWQDVAARAGVTMHSWSLEQLSRGHLPRHAAGLVIIDEAHRLRHPATKRVQTLAPWLVGRRVLLLTATPIVNRLRDLLHLLSLFVPDGALGLDGIPSLRALEESVVPPAALRRLVIRSPVSGVHLQGIRTTIRADAGERRRAGQAVADINLLSLSHDTEIRRLLRTVLLDAAASSDAAFRRALQRYRALLLHSRDAGGISRQTIRRMVGDLLEQTVMWQLMGPTSAGELDPGDIPRLDAALARTPDDGPWMNTLAGAIGSDRIAVCFTRHRATALALRGHLGESTAWVTGGSAGIGPHRLPRSVVLDAFGQRRGRWTARRTPPRLLVATDVAAEGLDLQSAGCIAHVDLPWTDMRLTQREGRLLRLGQQNATVKIIVREPASTIERALGPQRRIRRKATLSARWLAALEEIDPEVESEAEGHPMVAIITDGGPDAAVVAVSLTRGGQRGVCLLAQEASKPWTTDAVRIRALCARAGQLPAAPSLPLRSDDRAVLTEALGTALRLPVIDTAPVRDLMVRIQRLARLAARQRDQATLHGLDHLLRFASTPQPLGGRMLLDRLGQGSDLDLIATPIPASARPEPVAGRLLAGLLFRSSGSRLR